MAKTSRAMWSAGFAAWTFVVGLAQLDISGLTKNFFFTVAVAMILMIISYRRRSDLFVHVSAKVALARRTWLSSLICMAIAGIAFIILNNVAGPAASAPPLAALICLAFNVIWIGAATFVELHERREGAG